MKRHVLLSFPTLLLVVLGTGIWADVQATGFTRDQAYQYLRNTILGTSVTEIKVDASVYIVTSTSQVICGNDTITSPTFSSWLFAVDSEFIAYWEHPLALYFIDETNLANWIKHDVNMPVENCDMECVAMACIGGGWSGGFQVNNTIPFATPDPNLKAIITEVSQLSFV